jgi:hypothetical protein
MPHLLRTARSGAMGATLTLALAWHTPAAVAQTAAPTTGAAKYNEVLGLMCPGMALKLANPPELVPALKERPVDIQQVCRCTMKEFEADTRLQAMLAGEDSVVQKRVADPAVKGYLTLRLMRSMLGCVLPEYDAALASGLPRP